MAEIVLHIGTHKTGTTTIQDTLFQSRAALAAHGIVYPAIGRASGHHTLATRWITLPPHYRGPRPPLALWHELADAHAGGTDTILLSSEEFSRGRPRSVDLPELARLVAPFARRRVVCVLRDQVGLLQSAYLEVAKKRAAIPFGRYVAHALATGYAGGLHADYRALHARLLEAFAPEEIVYLSYAALRADPAGFVPAFLAALGLAVPAGTLAALPRSANVSPPPLPFLAALRITAPARPLPAQVTLAAAVIAERFGPGPTTLYRRDEIAAVEATFGPANAAFLAACGRPDLALPCPRHAPDTVYRCDLDPRFWAALAGRFAQAQEAAGEEAAGRQAAV
jgi:hypothetical protein